MLKFMSDRFLYSDKNLTDYCRKSTDETIRKLTEKYKLKRTEPKYENILDNIDNPNTPELNFSTLFIFLSISTIGLYFYRRLN